MRLELGLYRFEFKAIPLIVALTVVAVCCRLGFWQLHRAAQKIQRLAQIEQYRKLDKITLANLLELMHKTDVTGVELQLTGRFVSKAAWLLDNRTVQGQPGYDVLLPLQVPGYAQNVLVNMGWIAGNYGDRSILPEVDIPQGQITLSALVKAGDLNSFTLTETTESTSQWPRRVQSINPKAFEQQSELRLFPFVVYAQSTPDYGFTHHYQPVVMPPEKHKAYALQWFGLSIAALLVFIFASRVKPTEENERERT